MNGYAEPNAGSNKNYLSIRNNGGWNDYGQTNRMYLVEFNPIPESTTFILLGVGVISLLGHTWRRRS